MLFEIVLRDIKQNLKRMIHFLETKLAASTFNSFVALLERPKREVALCLKVKSRRPVVGR